MSAFELYTPYEFFCFFLIYAFLGWCAEVAYAALSDGKFVNRGFLNGPVCPIYGFGVVLVIGALTPLKENGALLFAGSVVLTSALEWITGFVLEKIFHDKWWDYSDVPFNLNGYICLKFSVLWGLACMFIMDIFHPAVVALIELFPRPIGWVILVIGLLLLCVDAGVTASSIFKLNKRMEQMDEIAEKLREASDRLGETISENVIEFAEKSEEWKEKGEDAKEELQAEIQQRLLRTESEFAVKQQELKEQIQELRARYEELAGLKKVVHKRMMKAFPGLKSSRHAKALEEIKKRYGLK